jgi:hypothetical protein
MLGGYDTLKLKRMLITSFFGTLRVVPLPRIELYARYYSSCELQNKRNTLYHETQGLYITFVSLGF